MDAFSHQYFIPLFLFCFSFISVDCRCFAPVFIFVIVNIGVSCSSRSLIYWFYFNQCNQRHRDQESNGRGGLAKRVNSAECSNAMQITEYSKGWETRRKRQTGLFPPDC